MHTRESLRSFRRLTRLLAPFEANCGPLVTREQYVEIHDVISPGRPSNLPLLYAELTVARSRGSALLSSTPRRLRTGLVIMVVTNAITTNIVKRVGEKT